MRTVLCAAFLLVAARPAAAEPDVDTEAVARIIGGKAWAQLLPWRQKMVLCKYGRFKEQPEHKQRQIKDLRRWLLEPSRKPRRDKLPKELRMMIDQLPSDMRLKARKFVMMRWRQLELDHALRQLPELAERRSYFDRLFPEPYDHREARAASRELRKNLIKRYALQFKEQSEERKQKVGELLKERILMDRERFLRQIEREMRGRLRHGSSGKRMGRGFIDMERIRMNATPRERELLRYALRPRECPLLDMRFMGRPPRDRPARRLWEMDYRILARLELFSEMNLPREMLLHLAQTGSPEDLLRAFRAVRGGHRRG